MVYSSFSSSVFADLHYKIEKILLGVAGAESWSREWPSFNIERPKDLSLGDLACNAAMVLAKPWGKKPAELAAAMVAGLNADSAVRMASVAGPGFVNIFLHDSYWQNLLAIIHQAGRDYGRINIGRGEKTNVEFVSANPTGPLHVGHARGAVFGDVLARLLRFAGFDVTAEYYINDAGAQVDTLARSLYFRYQQAVDKNMKGQQLPLGCYPGDYLVQAGITMAEQLGDIHHGKDEAAWLPLFKERAVELMMVEIKSDLIKMGIAHDVFSSEKKLVAMGKVNEVLIRLETEEKIYEGVLEKPKGKTPDDWEPRPQKLFKSTLYGDEIDRPIQKSDGSFTYFANDIAYHLDKHQRGATRLIDVLGADHAGYVKRIVAAVQAVSGGRARLHCLTMQVVRFMEGGQPLKMSKRAGNFIMLRDVIDAVGADLLRLYLLTRRPDTQMDFDYEVVKSTSRDNPVFYLHYAAARSHSLGLLITKQFPDIQPDFSPKGLARLQHPLELQVIKILATFPKIIEQAAQLDEPHRIVFYLLEVAASFHQLWTAGRDSHDLKFLQNDDKELTAARLALVAVVRQVMDIGGAVIGITWKNELR